MHHWVLHAYVSFKTKSKIGFPTHFYLSSASYFPVERQCVFLSLSFRGDQSRQFRIPNPKFAVRNLAILPRCGRCDPATRPINLCAYQRGRGTSIYCPSRAKDADNFLVQVHPMNATSRPRITRIQTWRRPPSDEIAPSLPRHAYLYSGRLLRTERRCSSQLITLSPLTTMTPRLMLPFNVSALSPSTSSCLSWLAPLELGFCYGACCCAYNGTDEAL